MSRTSRPVLYLCGLAFLSNAEAGPGINQFEVKDLEVEVGRWEFQSQNAWSWNQPGRESIEEPPGEIVFDENTVVERRHALEIELGISPRLRARFGVEFEQERIDDPEPGEDGDAFETLEFEELALEAVLVLVPVEENGVGLGLLAEYQYTLSAADPDSLVIGPIFEAAGEHWSLILNPALLQFLDSADGDNKRDFTYAAQLARRFSPSWLLTLEAYGTVDRIGSSGNPGEETELFGDHDQHRLGPIVYFEREFGQGDDASELRLGLGILAGLNDDTPDGTFKLSVEYEF